MKIEILYFDGCPHHVPATRQVESVLGELGVSAEVVHVDVPDQKAAERLRFPGSPTIRIDGADIVSAGDEEAYALQCRVYSTPNGLAGVPDAETIRAAIRAAGASPTGSPAR